MIKINKIKYISYKSTKTYVFEYVFGVDWFTGTLFCCLNRPILIDGEPNFGHSIDQPDLFEERNHKLKNSNEKYKNYMDRFWN